MKLYLKRMQGGILVPDNDESAEYIGKLKLGEVISAEGKKPRNYKFLKKYMALMQLGFDAFEPSQEYKGQSVEKNFDRFRKDITILSGYYHLVPSVKGEPRAEADSISFGNMDEDTFAGLYNKTIDTLIRYVLKNYTHDDVNNVVNELMGFG